MDIKVLNPKTNRQIKVGTQTFKTLLKEGYVYDEVNNVLSINTSLDDVSDLRSPVQSLAINQKTPIKQNVKPTRTLFAPLQPSDTKVKVMLPDIHVNNIVHISDIHIPINLHSKRLEEYIHVFHNLYDYLKTNIELSTSLIVVTGDLLHTKIKLEAETLQLARDFLHNLSQLTHTVVIIGNHDFTENNKERTDTLSAVADRLPVHILKHTGIYQFGTIQLVFNSLFDNKFIKRRDVPITNLPVYALFHGTVVGSKTESGLELKESVTKQYPTIADFSGYDAVLLGHVHKQQFLRPNIAYAGSLIQQNFGEHIQGHGLLLWNTMNHSAKPIDIPNMFVHLNMSVVDGQLTPDSHVLLKNHIHSRLYIKCHCINTSPEQTEEIRRQLFVANYQIENFILSKPAEAVTTINHQLQNSLFLTLDEEVTFINEHAKPELAEQVINLHKKYYTEHRSNTGYWYPIMLSWRNIGIYGNDNTNHINFQTGVVDICSANMTGKSTIVNIILSALFHKTTTHKSSTDILNKYSSKGFIELDFIHNGCHYKIQKHVNKKLRSVRDTISETFETNFFSIDESGRLTNLNGSSQTATLSIIKQYVGTLEQFLDGNLISTRSDVSSILSKTPADLLKHFHRICNTEHYENYIKQCNIDSKAVYAELTKVRNTKEYIQTKLQYNNKSSIEENLLCAKQKLAHLQTHQKSLIEQRDSIITDIAKLDKPSELIDLTIPDLEQQISQLTTDRDKFPNVVLDTASNYLVEHEVDEEITELYDGIHINLPAIEDVEADLMATELELQEMLYNQPVEDSTILFTMKGKLESEINTIESKVTEISNSVGNSCNLTPKQLPINFNIDDAHFRLAGIKHKIDDIKPLLPFNLTIEILKQQLSELPDWHIENNIDELQLLLKQEKQKLEQFTLPCIETNLTEEQLRHQIKTLIPVPQKLEQPPNLSDQITDLSVKRDLLLTNNTVKHRDTWYSCYINGNSLNGVPLDIFKQYYNDTDRMEFNRVDELYRQLINIQKHNKDVDDIDKQNSQSKHHNSMIDKQLNWLHIQTLSQEISRLETCIKIVQLKEDVKNLDTLHQLQSQHDQCRELIDIYQYSLFHDQLKALESDKLEKQQQLALIIDKINWWIKHQELIDEQNEYNRDKIKIAENICTEQRITHLKQVKNYINVTDNIAQLTRQKHTIINHCKYMDLQQQLTQINEKITCVSSDVTVCNQQINQNTQLLTSINDLDKNQDKLLRLESEYSIYEEYKKLFDRKAIPALILKNKLQSFVDQTNQIFSDCSKYSLEYKITDKDKLEFTIIDNKTNARLEPHRLSGYETVALQIAMNKATIDIAAMHKTSLFIIDESLDCIDQERFPSLITKLCNIIKQHFTVTIIISHRDIPSDTVDQNIRISHTDNCSYIEN